MSLSFVRDYACSLALLGFLPLILFVDGLKRVGVYSVHRTSRYIPGMLTYHEKSKSLRSTMKNFSRSSVLSDRDTQLVFQMKRR